MCLGKFKLLCLIAADTYESKPAEIFGRFLPSSSLFQLVPFAPMSPRRLSIQKEGPLLSPCFSCRRSLPFATTSDGWGDLTLPTQLESRMRNESRMSCSERASPKTGLGNWSMASGKVLYLFLPPFHPGSPQSSSPATKRHS